MSTIFSDLVGELVALGGIMLISLIITILLYIFILPDSKQRKLGKVGNFIHEFLKMKKIYVEKVIRFFYVMSTVSGIISGIDSLGDSIIVGIVIIIFSPILTRLMYELIMLKIIEVKNVVEINNFLKKDGGESMFDSELGNNFAEKTSAVVTAAINAAKESVKAETVSPSLEDENVRRCPNCNIAVSDGKFCPKCGTKIEE